jgi:hypothetical protein
MQSGWHNCPTINGVMQKEGISYKANDVQFQQTANSVSLSMDIAAAYPADAAVKNTSENLILISQKIAFKFLKITNCLHSKKNWCFIF